MIIQFDSGAQQQARQLASHSRGTPRGLWPSHSLQMACALRLALRIIQFDCGVQKILWRSAKLSTVTKITSHPSHSLLMGLAWCQARMTGQSACGTFQLVHRLVLHYSGMKELSGPLYFPLV